MQLILGSYPPYLNKVVGIITFENFEVTKISTPQYYTPCACHFVEYLFQQLYYAFCLEDAITAMACVSPTHTDILINYFPSDYMLPEVFLPLLATMMWMEND